MDMDMFIKTRNIMKAALRILQKKKQKSNREFESRFHQFLLVYLYKNYIFRYILLAHSCQRRYIDRRQKFLFFSIAQRSI